MKQNKFVMVTLTIAILAVLLIGVAVSGLNFSIKSDDFKKQIMYSYSSSENSVVLKDNTPYDNAIAMSNTNFDNEYSFNVSTTAKRGEYTITLTPTESNTYANSDIVVFLTRNGKAVMNPIKVSELTDYDKDSKVLYKVLYGSKDVSIDEYSLKIWVSNSFDGKPDEYYYKLMVNVH